jgi:hypothetical protein
VSLHFEYICVDKKNKMGTSLSGTQIKTTYVGILKTTDNAAASSSLKTITDGQGNDTALSVSTSQVKVTNLLIDSPATSTSDQILVRDASTGLISTRTLPNLKTVQVSTSSGTTTNGTGTAIGVTITDSAGHASTANFQSGQNMTLRSSGAQITLKYDTRKTLNVTATSSVSATTDSGATVFLDCATLAGGTLTLPAASAGRFLRILVDVGSNTACNINAASGDYFYGAITHVSTTGNKTGVQTVTRATASAAVSTHNQLTLDQDSDNLGGAVGSFLELTCYDDAGWHVSGKLVGNSTNPTGIIVINGQ